MKLNNLSAFPQKLHENHLYIHQILKDYYIYYIKLCPGKPSSGNARNLGYRSVRPVRRAIQLFIFMLVFVILSFLVGKLFVFESISGLPIDGFPVLQGSIGETHREISDD